jgi:hypothetical protein
MDFQASLSSYDCGLQSRQEDTWVVGHFWRFQSGYCVGQCAGSVIPSGPFIHVALHVMLTYTQRGCI